MKLFILTFVTLIGLNALAKDEGITPEQKQKVAGLLRQISELDGGIEVTGVTDEAGNSSVTAKVSPAQWDLGVQFYSDNQVDILSITKTYPVFKSKDRESKGNCAKQAKKFIDKLWPSANKMKWSPEKRLHNATGAEFVGSIEAKFSKDCKLISLVRQGVN